MEVGGPLAELCPPSLPPRFLTLRLRCSEKSLDVYKMSFSAQYLALLEKQDELTITASICEHGSYLYSAGGTCRRPRSPHGRPLGRAVTRPRLTQEGMRGRKPESLRGLVRLVPIKTPTLVPQALT